jgi:hypothetical protein
MGFRKSANIKQMNKFQKLIILVEEANSEYHKFASTDNLSAAVRCRKALNLIRAAAQETRMEILKGQKEISLKRHLKS